MCHCCETTTIYPTSLEMQPCTCSGKCECTPRSAHALRSTLSSLAALLYPFLAHLERHCIQHRSLSRLCRLVQRPCAPPLQGLLCSPCSHTRLKEQLTAGPRSQQTLHGTSEHADGPAGSRPGALRLAHPCGTGRVHTAAPPAAGPEGTNGELKELSDTSVPRRRKELLIFI